MKPTDIKPPFTRETVILKVRLAENAWNSRYPDRVALVYTEDSHWRNRSEISRGRETIRQFLRRKWDRGMENRLVKELWAFTENRIAVRFQYEWRDDSGRWFRAYGNENWEFDNTGLMQRREASINDKQIDQSERRFHWDPGQRPDDHPGLINSPE